MTPCVILPHSLGPDVEIISPNYCSWLVGWVRNLCGWLSCLVVSCLIGSIWWLVDLVVGWFSNQLVQHVVGWFGGWLVGSVLGRFSGWLVDLGSFDSVICWLVGLVVGWFHGLFGWFSA